MFAWIKKEIIKSSPVLAAAILVGCGGGGGDSSSTENNSSEATIQLAPGGFYTSIGFSDGSTVDALTLLSPTGKFVVVVDFTDITVGTMQFGSNGSLTGSGTDVVYDGNWQSVSGSLSGTVTSASKATVKATAPGYESNSTLERDDIYSDLGVTLAQLTGTYLMSDPAVYTTSVTVSADGAVTGSDETGCVFNGQVTIPNTSFNVYEVSYSASNCADPQRNGNYFGLGAYDPELGEIEFAGTDGEVAAVFIGTK